MERMLLVMAKHFKHQRLRLDVINERFGHWYSELKVKSSQLMPMSIIHIFDVFICLAHALLIVQTILLISLSIRQINLK